MRGCGRAPFRPQIPQSCGFITNTIACYITQGSLVEQGTANRKKAMRIASMQANWSPWMRGQLTEPNRGRLPTNPQVPEQTEADK